MHALLGLPRSGSTWLAECFDWPRYYSEFFNPLTNEEYRHELEKAFGSEQHLDNVTKPWTKQENELNRVFDATWGKSGLQATKEVWCFSKVGWFAQKFQCVAIYRSPIYTFPGHTSSENTAYWFDSIWKSFIWNKNLQRPEIREVIELSERDADNDTQRRLCAHLIASAVLLLECTENDIPVLDWSELMVTNNLEKMLAKVPGIDIFQTAHRIAATRTGYAFLQMKLLDFMELDVGEWFEKMVERFGDSLGVEFL